MEGQIAAYRFVHTADVHLDSPLRSLALRNPELADLIGNATRKAFERTISLCLDERVDALLLAGDLYDGEQTSMKTARFLAEQLRKLGDAGIETFIVRGNHDAMSKITRELTFPESVRLFSGRSEAIPASRRDGGCPVLVHGISFAQPTAPDSLVGKFKPAESGAVNIGLMHSSVGGSPRHDPYAPCSLTELHDTGFQYWALGHIHKRWQEKGRATVVMPGIPQGRDINEAGAKSVSLVAIGDDGSAEIEERTVSIAQFERVRVNAGGIADWPALVGAVGQSLRQAREAAVSDHLVARIEIGGSSPLAWKIRRDLDVLKEEAEIWASRAGNCWIEKLEADCRPPPAEGDATGDPVGELTGLIHDQVLHSPAFQAEAAAILKELQGALPPEARKLLGDDEASVEAAIGLLAEEGAADVVARLRSGGGA